MIEKLFIISFISFIVFSIHFHSQSYDNDLREYFYCTAYNKEEDPSIPPLSFLELDNFEKNYPGFNTKYNCKTKLYTRKQFYIMRKTRK